MRDQLHTFSDEEFDEEEEDTLEGRHLIFSIEARNYGIEIQHITEIVGLQPITEVPDMPAFVKGVINLRGKIIPLIDVRSRFKLAEIEYNDKTSVIILKIKNQFVGLIVDMVREVIKINNDQLEEAPRFGDNEGNRFVKALAKVKDEVKILLDIERLLSEGDFERVETVLQEA